MLTDPGFANTTFAVIDFEGLTPAGRPPEPIEVAVVAGRFDEAGHWVETGRFESLMRPPDNVPVTRYDHELTGLTRPILDRQLPAADVMAALDGRFSRPPYRVVAHSAHTEATLIAGQREHCPVLAALPMLCTVKMSRAAFPDLRRYNLDAVLRFLGIPVPPGRHRAMPDAEVTVQVLQHALAAGRDRGVWRTLPDIDRAAGIAPRPVRRADADPAAEPLF